MWDFALSLYARPGVEPACLTLQDDHGQCAPLLLWRLWALTHRVDAATLSSAIVLARDWDERTVAPLRAVRRALAAPAPPIRDTARLALRETVKATELEAERLLLETLEALTPTDEAGDNAAIDASAALADLVNAWSRPAPAGLLSLLADAAASVTLFDRRSGYGHER